MKRLALTLCLAASACATAPKAPPPVVEKPALPPLPVRPFAKPTPLQLVAVPSGNSQVVSVRLVFAAGSVDDPKGKEGLTALTTALLAEGGTQSLSASEFAQALFPMAAEFSASTNKEFTVFAGRVHKDRFDAFLKLFADVLVAPRLDAKDFDRLRSRALNDLEKRLRGENDEELSKAALDALLFEGHPYRHPVGGTVASLKALTLADVKAHWKNVFTQERAVLGLAAPAQDTAAWATKTTQALAALPAVGAPLAPLPAVVPKNGEALIIQRDTLSTAGAFGVPYNLRRGDADFFPMAMAMSYLGEHRQMHGQLFMELREKRGLNYGTYAYAEHYQQEGWTAVPRVNVGRTQQDAMIWLRPVEPKNAMFATRSAVQLLRELVEKPIPQKDFDAARGFLIGATYLWEQTDQRRLGYAIDDVFYGTPGFMGRFRASLEVMTPEEAQGAVKKHLSPEALNFAFVTQDAKALREALESGAPTPITYPSPKTDEVLKKDVELSKAPLKPKSVRVLPASQFMEQ